MTLSSWLTLLLGLTCSAFIVWQYRQRKSPTPDTDISTSTQAAQIDALLPQTQCGQCGHPGCRPYAEAIAAGEPINHCVPGGQATIDKLATLLHRPTLLLDPEYGIESDSKKVAFIREDECIGCTKCIQACPVDAILGAAQKMHTVISSECTGCDLCVAPCPVDCIEMIPVSRLQPRHSPTDQYTSAQRIPVRELP